MLVALCSLIVGIGISRTWLRTSCHISSYRRSRGLSLGTSEIMIQVFITWPRSVQEQTKLSQPTSTLITCVVMQDLLL